jgi:hypothetical protein
MVRFFGYRSQHGSKNGQRSSGVYLLAGSSFKVITYDLFGTASLYKTQLSFINFIMKRLMLRVGRIVILFG